MADALAAAQSTRDGANRLEARRQRPQAERRHTLAIRLVTVAIHGRLRDIAVAFWRLRLRNEVITAAVLLHPLNDRGLAILLLHRAGQVEPQRLAVFSHHQ